ncbi:MAG TPA: hypothetical protein DDX19_25325 [Rhodopirellula baltica]|nr:hypothetical protein [Rhodopirellula baltica]
MNENLLAHRGANVRSTVMLRYPWVRFATNGYHPRPLRGRNPFWGALTVGSLRDPRLPSSIPSGSVQRHDCEAVIEGSRGSRSAPSVHERSGEPDPNGGEEGRS